MKLIKYLLYCLKFSFSWNKKYKTKWVDEIPTPSDIKDNIFYIVGNKKYPFQVVSKCPMKLCSQLVQTNIMKNLPDSKKWVMTEHGDNSISLYPSVWLTRECSCHYWVDKGEIHWCNRLDYKNWINTKNSVNNKEKRNLHLKNAVKEKVSY